MISFGYRESSQLKFSLEWQVANKPVRMIHFLWVYTSILRYVKRRCGDENVDIIIFYWYTVAPFRHKEKKFK